MIRITIIVFFISPCILWAESSVFLGSKQFQNHASVSTKLHPKFSPADTLSVVEPPLMIGSFNIQTLTRKKFERTHVMGHCGTGALEMHVAGAKTYAEIIHRYDLILILEIHTTDDYYTKKLLKDLNRDLPPGEVYNMVLSEKHNATTEHYAIYYKTNKLKLIASESYDDRTVFYRKPLVAIFEAFTLRDMKKFGVVGQHAKPSQAVQEIDGLAGVYDYIKDTYKTEDVLLMGDFNADCTYVKENDWQNISLWYRSEFTWAITGKTDTTTNYRSCALDRFVYAGENLNDGVILSSARVFDFQEAFNLDIYETRNISDHWPIELRIRGKMSKIAEKHLTAKLCFSVEDSRQTSNITFQNVYKLAKRAFFTANETKDGILLSNRTREEKDMITALSNIRTFLPNVVSHELAEAIKYKVSHGSLRDDSSFADVYDSRYILNVLTRNEFVTAFVCKTTTVN